MAKIVVECTNPNDLDEVESIMDQVIGRCNITYFKQHQGMVEAGTSKSKSESARIIAEDTEESPDAVRMRISRGEKESEQPVQQKSNPPQSQQVINIPNLTDAGGKRKGAGRKPARSRPKLTLCDKERIMDEDFKDGFNLLLRAIKNAKHSKWKTTSKEAALKHIDILNDVITIT